MRKCIFYIILHVSSLRTKIKTNETNCQNFKNAQLQFHTPGSYKKGMYSFIPRHIHANLGFPEK